MTRIELLAHLLSGSAGATKDGAGYVPDHAAKLCVAQANRIADLVLADPQVVAEQTAAKRGRA